MRAALVVLAPLCYLPSASDAFSIIAQEVDIGRWYKDTSLQMAKAVKNKKKKQTGGGGAAAAITKGFGGPVLKTSSSASASSVEIDRSSTTGEFYRYMERFNAEDNLCRCVLGFFQSPSSSSRLRGIVATRDASKGETLIRIPYELAVNLGPEGVDPTLPALEFLKGYCRALKRPPEQDAAGADASSSRRRRRGDDDGAPYYRMLPPYRGEDCLGSTDFFSDEALDALQYPLVKSETLLRRELTQKRFELAKGEELAELFWIDGTPLTVDHLRWAVWIITSRVLTVQQGAEGTDASSSSYRLLIPFLDMCNHDRTSPHVLTGRAAPEGELKVVAGANVKAGDPINICYGGGQAGNDRFIQDYGFLDNTGRTEDAGYLLVAQQLMGKRRLLEGSGMGQFISESDREESLELLRQTTMVEDAEFLAVKTSDTGLRSAYQFRLGLKRALSKFIAMR